MDTDFDNQVRVALAARRGAWKAIAKNAGVSHSWISQFCRNKIPNPGIGTLRLIAGALSTPGAQAAEEASSAT